VVNRVGLRSPLGAATIDKLLEDVAVRGDRIQTELAFQPRMGLQAGWADALGSL
jgi:hypothetical protein